MSKQSTLSERMASTILGQSSGPHRKGASGENMHGNLVFVYGTLKSGGVRDTIMEQFAELIGEFHTDAAWKMYTYGDAFPCITLDYDHNGVIHGELWSVDEFAMPWLDKIESFYTRSLISVKDDQGNRAAAWAYNIDNPTRLGFAPPTESSCIQMWEQDHTTHYLWEN